MSPAGTAILPRSSTFDAASVWAVMAVAYAAYLVIFLPLLPANGSGLGHDYTVQLPNLLAGTFFFRQNGLWQVPWFSPGECGGVPFFADLNVGYYSLPQFLAFLFDPLTAVRVSFAIFAAVGGWGMYALVRSRFGASPFAAAAAAVLFLFNGFYVYRFAIGHVTFHPVMLAPWLAFVLLPGDRPQSVAIGSVLGGALLAYMFQAGMVHAIVPLALATALVLLAHGHIAGHAVRPWLAFAGSAVVAVALSAARLVAALAFLRGFPRSDYPLPGFANVWMSLRVAVESVFWLPPVAAGWAALTNRGFELQQHEWEYGIGSLAALLIVAGILTLVVAWTAKADRARRFARVAPIVAAFLVVLALPVALNWYTPGWNAFLKRVPLLESSSTLLRWFVLYIPLAALFAGLAVDRLARMAVRPLLLLAVVLSVVGLNAFSDKRFYLLQPYDAHAITAAWRSVAYGGGVPPVTALVRADAAAVLSHTENNALAHGQSQLDCHQPMFGYKLEHFDAANLHSGPVSDVDAAGNLNLKNPACYLYPGENQCRPGATFAATAIGDAQAFAAYRPYPFQVSTLQRAADWLNLAAILACLAVLAIAPLRRWRPARRLDPNRPSG
jgi:hypothetical protein